MTHFCSKNGMNLKSFYAEVDGVGVPVHTTGVPYTYCVDSVRTGVGCLIRWLSKCEYLSLFTVNDFADWTNQPYTMFTTLSNVVSGYNREAARAE